MVDGNSSSKYRGSRHRSSRSGERHHRRHPSRSVSPRPSSDRRDHGSSHRHQEYKGSQSRRQRSPRGHEKQAELQLPYGARQLSKGDLQHFEAFFAHYLSLQKQKDIDDMDEREIKGRWKSFMGKWNRGELAEGWYDPEMYQRITSANDKDGPSQRQRHVSREPEPRRGDIREDEDSEEDYGPALPGEGGGRRAGASIPSIQDLAVRDEMNAESREAERNDLRAARKADRRLQKERLEDLVPRAEPGTRERKLEKRQEVNAKMKEFRDKSPGMDGGNEKELMGGGDELEEYKKEKERQQRRKTERELRREEIQRAKQEEMEEKKRKWQEREQGTMSMLQELAKQRFG